MWKYPIQILWIPNRSNNTWYYSLITKFCSQSCRINTLKICMLKDLSLLIHKVYLLNCLQILKHLNILLIRRWNWITYCVSHAIYCYRQNLLLSNIPPREWWYKVSISAFPWKILIDILWKTQSAIYTNGQNIHLQTEKQFMTPAFKWMKKVSEYTTPLIQKKLIL